AARLGLPGIHRCVPLAALGFLDLDIDPVAVLRLQPADQFLALDGQLRLDVLGRVPVRGLDDQAVDELGLVAHYAASCSVEKEGSNLRSRFQTASADSNTCQPSATS